MLKHFRGVFLHHMSRPAAFGRLCVETMTIRKSVAAVCPAAFGRLCVETQVYSTELLLM